MKTKLILVPVLLFVFITSNAQQIQKGSVAYYESMRIAFQTKIDWVQNNPEEHTLAIENNWFEMANANVQQMVEYKSLAEHSANGIYLPNENHNINTGPEAGGGTCTEAAPFCTDYAYGFACGTDEPPAETGPDYGCLGSEPNPAWYYLQVADAGDLIMSLSAPADIDFIIWGPFTNITCSYDSLFAGNIVDCSYSSTNQETPEIGPGSSEGPTVAVSGEYYMFLITNYSNSTQDFSLQQTGGLASTSCCSLSPITPIDLSVLVENCHALQTDTGNISLHSLSGSVSFTDDPILDSIVISYDGVPFQSNYPPFSIPLSFVNNDLLSNDISHNVAVRFYNSGGFSCFDSYTYYAADSCSACVVDAGNDLIDCNPLSANASIGASDISGTWYADCNDVIFTDINSPITDVNYNGNSSDTINCNLYWSIINIYGITCVDTINAIFLPKAQMPIAIEQSEVVCEGGESTYSVEYWAENSYQWIIPTGWTSTSLDTNTIMVTNNGTSGQIQVFAINACGSSDTLIINVTITDLVAAQPSVISGPNPACANSSVIYSVIEIPGVTYFWNLPIGWSGSGYNSDISVTIGNAGGTITLVPFNDCGMGVARTLNVSIQEPVGEISSVSGETMVCEGSIQIYTASAADNASGYTWVLPNGWTGNSNFESISTIAGESGAIQVTAYNNCGYSGSDSILIYVDPLPTANYGFSINLSEVDFTNLSQDADSYVWDFGDGASSTEVSPIHEYTDNGTYTVELTAQNDCGETIFASYFTIISIGINDVNASSINCYPNPSSGLINIEGLNSEGAIIELIDVSGRIVFQKEINRGINQVSINLSSLNEGIYQLIIKQRDKIRKEQIIIQK